MYYDTAHRRLLAHAPTRVSVRVRVRVRVRPNPLAARDSLLTTHYPLPTAHAHRAPLALQADVVVLNMG